MENLRRLRRRSPSSRPPVPPPRRQDPRRRARRRPRRTSGRGAPQFKTRMGPRAVKRGGRGGVRRERPERSRGVVAKAQSRVDRRVRRGRYQKRPKQRWCSLHARDVRVAVRSHADERARREGAAPADEVRRLHRRRGGGAYGARPVACSRKGGSGGQKGVGGGEGAGRRDGHRRYRPGLRLGRRRDEGGGQGRAVLLPVGIRRRRGLRF